jgi:endonuclease/exonuclease/phosphatase family metal-dependent hydrolase
MKLVNNISVLFIMLDFIINGIYCKFFTPNENLCNISDLNDIKCKLEYYRLFEEANFYLNQNYLKILEYNIDKSGYGGDSPFEKGYKPIINYLEKLHNQENFDIIILIEVARNCFYQNEPINTTQKIAEKLKMNFVYGVEYYIPNYSTKETQCTIGNAILSRHKLTNFNQLVFKSQCCSYPNQIGRRLAVQADIFVNNKNFKIYSVHLESGRSDSFKSIYQSFITRHNQSKEIIENILTTKNNYEEVFVIGDFNSPLIYLDYSIKSFYKLNYHDSHKGFFIWNRMTCPFNGVLSKLRLGNLDYIFSKNYDHFIESKIWNHMDEYYGLSDHMPIMTKYLLK